MSYDTVIPFFETFRRLLVDAAAPQSGERVLDLACGRGASTLPAAAAVGPAGRVVGVDLAPEMVLATAAALSAPGMRHGETRVMDAERLDFPRACFDVVLCGFGVFFFPHPAAAVAEIRRVLDPQTGRFAASTFVRGVGGYRWAADVVRGLGRQRPSFPGPIKTAVELVELLSEAGLPANVSTAQARFVFPGVDDISAGCGYMAADERSSNSVPRSESGIGTHRQRTLPSTSFQVGTSWFRRST